MNIVINRNDVLKDGWLLKQSRLSKEWRRRWLVLTHTHLCSFKGPEQVGSKPTELLALKDCTAVKCADDDVQKENVFRVDTPMRVFMLIAESSDEKEAWIGAIQRQMVRSDDIVD